jgi:hypothetical protein
VPKVSTLLIVAALIVGGVVAFDRFGRDVRIQTQTVIGQPVQLTSNAGAQAAAANARSAAALLEAFHAANGTYAGAPAPGATVAEADQSSYCIESTVARQTVSIRGPGGTVVAGAC